jgi:limonene-1,2-epoxide hydrolase
MKPREVVQAWLAARARADAEALVSLYAREATYLLPTGEALVGRDVIRDRLAHSILAVPVRVQESLFEDGEWAILEWTEPQGARGCSIFHIPYGRIVAQRDYWHGEEAPPRLQFGSGRRG